jgi:hypothetical protein
VKIPARPLISRNGRHYIAARSPFPRQGKQGGSMSERQVTRRTFMKKAGASDLLDLFAF